MAPAPLIITVAPNGARKGKDDHPAVPITAAEIAHTAAACKEAGAAMIHMHVRDAEGRHSLDPAAYREAIAATRRAVGDDLLIQVTTEAAGLFQAAEQMAAIRELRPEAISAAVRELIPDSSHEAAAADFFAWTDRERISVQYILYDADDLRRFNALRERGVLPARRAFLLFVLGRYSRDQQSDPRDLLPFLEALDGADDAWAVCAFGAREAACVLTAAGLGGHARVGFENNLLLADGSMAPDNAALVHQVSDSALALGRTVADAAAARTLFNAL